MSPPPPKPRINKPPAIEERGVPFQWYDIPIVAGFAILTAIVLVLT